MKNWKILLIAFLLSLFVSLELITNIAIFQNYVLTSPHLIVIFLLIFFIYFVSVVRVSTYRFR